ncbi:MAG: 16S rRNA processing protein RimM [Ruminococcaceae bacterium]|nr:16S rRNA processing protein RimM [Oscillospiraceae bacterium]
MMMDFYFSTHLRKTLMGRNLAKYLEAGKIANTHGVRGDIVVDSLCDSPKILAELKTLYIKRAGEYVKMDVARSSLHQGRVLMRFEGVNSLDDAILYKGKSVYAARDDLKIPEDQIFIADLIGLDVFRADNKEKLGKISDVVNYGFNDILEIDRGQGVKTLVPNLEQFVEKISLEEGVFIIPVEGLLE